MNRYLKEVANPKGPDELRFKKKHVTIKHRDRNGNGDDVFNATNIKTVDRSEGDYKHGYDLKQSDAVYEAQTVRSADYTVDLVLGPDGKVHKRRLKKNIQVGDVVMKEETVNASVEKYTDKDGTFWHLNGKRHREDGPAIEWANGNEEWYRNGKFHREDGPAVKNSNGAYWYTNNKLHRKNGPAIELKNGTKKWYLNGREHTKESHAIATRRLKESFQGPKGVSPNRSGTKWGSDYAPSKKPKRDWDRSKRTVQEGKSLRDIVGTVDLEEGFVRKVGSALAAGTLGAAAMAGVGALKNRGPSFYDRSSVYDLGGSAVGWKDKRLRFSPKSWRDKAIFRDSEGRGVYRDDTIHESTMRTDKDKNKEWVPLHGPHRDMGPRRDAWRGQWVTRREHVDGNKKSHATVKGLKEAIIHNVPLVPMMKKPKTRVDWLDKPQKVKVRFLDRDKRSPDRIGEEKEKETEQEKRYRAAKVMSSTNIRSGATPVLKSLQHAYRLVSKTGPNKLQSEETEINELSKATLGRYLAKAGWSAKWNGDTAGMTNAGLDSRANRKARNRANGIARVGLKLQKEEAEVNEVSNATLKSYIDGAAKERDLAYPQGRHPDRWKIYYYKRKAGVRMADQKLYSNSAGRVNEKLQKEESEINEISAKTLGSYVKGATASVRNRTLDLERYRAGNKNLSYKEHGELNDIEYRTRKRQNNIGKAADKLVKKAGE